ncbi:MAG: lamin tail domain-containing protein [Phycisphaerales bacterium]|nr:MAG: lamin tail domain-containing protein [Phycisphaerales bacterium]
MTRKVSWKAKLVLLALLFASLAARAGANVPDTEVCDPAPVGDLTGDCKVDWQDVARFALDWLAPPGGGSSANLDGFDGVDMADFALLAENWRVVGRKKGSLLVTIFPEQAVNKGAKWCVDGGPWLDSDFTATDLAVGVHRVDFKDIYGWAKPRHKMVEIHDRQTAAESGEYKRPLVISEFMAVNDGTLQDPRYPYEYPDWIEIYNPTATTIDLGGWYLANWNSDNPDPNLRDWQFPDVNIGPGKFLVVLASGNDVRDPCAPYLHADFKLAPSDECVAIVAPDGNTVVHEYRPYPEQLSDVSYGLAQYVEMLVPAGADVRYHVPGPQEAHLDWTNPDFNDSPWEPGRSPLDFEAGAEEIGRDIGSPAAPGSWLVINDLYVVQGDGEDIWTGPSTPGDDFYYVYTPLSGNGQITARIMSIEHTDDNAKAGVMIREDLTDTSSHAAMVLTTPAGHDTYAFQWVNGGDRDNRIEAADVTLPCWVRIVRLGDDFSGYYAPDKGGVPWPADWIEQGAANIPMAGSVYIGLCVTSCADGTLCTAVFDDVERAGEIGSRLRDLMSGANASLWTRIDFHVEDPDFYDAMTLSVRYEDAYVAYLNGAEVARKNFTGTPTWNSTADENRADELSSEFETVSLNEFLDLLRPMPQKNVLAVQAMNDSVSDEQFLILPELTVAKNEEVPQYFTSATPRRPNIAGAGGRVSEVWFSHKRGFYESSFELTLSTEMTDPDVRIMYTTDGSRPTQTHGIEYVPGFPLPIDGTTVIRAAAVRPGWLGSRVETHSYIFCADVIKQSLDGEAPGAGWPAPGYFNGQLMDYGMDRKVVLDDARYSGQAVVDALEAVATISLVTDLDNLFHPSEGIYVNACNNGRAWERPCSVELIYPPNPQGPGFPDIVPVRDANGLWRLALPAEMRGGFQIDSGIRIRGGFSCSGDDPKHAFRLFFRSAYGDATLRYPLFGDEGDDVFDHVDLRCSQNFSWAFEGDNKNTMVREVFSRDLQGQMDQPYTRSRYYHLYINGHYWGLYQTQERSEASWARSYMGGDKEDYDVVTSSAAAGRRMVPTDGSRAPLDRLYDQTIAGFGDYESYCRVQGLNIDGTRNDAYERLLDVENLIDFMIIEYYTGDSDGPGSRFGGIPDNTWGVFNRVNPDGWKWLHHDNEQTLGAGGKGGSVENLVEPFTSAGASRDYFNPHWLHEQLMFSNADYRMKFADRVHRHFHNGGLLSVERSRSRILERAYQIEKAIVAESARWGDAKHSFWAHTKDDHWWPEIDRLLYETFDPWGRKTYLTPRVETVLRQFSDVGWYPSVKPPVFAALDEYIFVDNPNGFGTIYYTLDGIDPRVPVAQSAPGALVTFVAEDAAKRYLVPSPANGGNLLGNAPGEFDVTYYQANITVGSIAAAESVIANPSYQSRVIGERTAVINYNNTNCPGHFPYDNPVAGGSGDLDDYVIEATAVVQIPRAGKWTFGVHSDAGFSLELGGPGSFYMDYPSPRSADDSLSVFDVTAPGAYNLRLVFFERGGWSGVEVFAAQGIHTTFGPDFRLVGDMAGGGLQVGEQKVWFASLFDHSGWSAGTGGIGYETEPAGDQNYVGLFDTDVRGLMYDDGGNPNANTSCYVRIPFACAVVEYSSLMLKVRYDAGFIAYLNGAEVARRIFPEGAEPKWSSSTYPNQHDDALAVALEPIDISDHIKLLREGNNTLAFHAMNISTASPDFLISAELVAAEAPHGDISPHALVYDSYLVLDKSTNVKARVLHGKTWSALTEDIYAIGPLAEKLRITEIMYHPLNTGDPNDPNEEFIELTNVGAQTINLNLVRFTKGIDFTFPPIDLQGGRRVVVVKNRSAFEAEHPGSSPLIAGEYSGSLDNAGERIRLEDAVGRTILDFKYDDNWRPLTDGAGFSLTIIDPANRDPNSWGLKDSWCPSAFAGGSPGADDAGLVPDPGAVVINEVLAHSHGTAPDWIELYNTAGFEIDLGGWFLSDSDFEPAKYEIAEGTVIGAYGYRVFYEDANFGEFSADPGRLVPFALSEHGDAVCLTAGRDGVLMGYREYESFGASQAGVSFARHFNEQTGGVDFTAASAATAGRGNAGLKVGPIVISEIMYNPVSGDQKQEFVELHNCGAADLTLYDSNEALSWKFTDGIDYTFPDYPGLTIPGGGYALVVKDANAYQDKYGPPPSGVALLGPYSGRLSNSGEKLELSRPGDVDSFGVRHYIRIEQVRYSDGSHPEDFDLPPFAVDPWRHTAAADGGGMSLSRMDPNSYGQDPTNWRGAVPSPGW